MKILGAAFLFLVTATIAPAQSTEALTYPMLKALQREGVQVRLTSCAPPPCTMSDIPANATVKDILAADQISLAGLKFNKFPEFIFGMKELKYLDISNVSLRDEEILRLSELGNLEILIAGAYADFNNEPFFEMLLSLRKLKSLTIVRFGLFEQIGFVIFMAENSPNFLNQLVELKMYDSSPDEKVECNRQYQIPLFEFRNLRTLEITSPLSSEYSDIFTLPSLVHFRAPTGYSCGANNTIHNRLN
ncbi:hypothetical protein Sulfitobl28_36320 (plasmid) [Sulfitobacter pontiacus]|nr:hypothetical protein Sulfitobl28_36090 [Sulfitobacter pontiacus]BDY17660.1 hypothetical protein Sulfitobl28_36320 [Sulfitobacter pontiacus]